MSDTHTIETIDPALLSELQSERLKKTVRWAKDKSAFYRERLSDISPEEITRPEDAGRLPFTTKADLVKTSPFDFLTMPMSGLLRITQRGGSEPVTKMYSPTDVANNVEMALRALRAAGVNRTSVVGVLGDTSGGALLDFQYAAEMLGALTIPLGENLRQDLEIIDLVGVDTLIAGQQHVMKLIVEVQTWGKEPSELTLQRVFCVYDAIQNPMKRHILDRLQVQVYGLYDAAELGTAGMLHACSTHVGAHVQEDMYLTEVVEFGAETPIKEAGRMGELVVSTLVAEAMPILRYRTGQAVMRILEPCACGSKRMRLVTPFTH